MAEPERARAFYKQLADRVDERLYGVGGALKLVMVGILTGNHVLIDDVPGVGKTTLVRMLAALLGLRFQRVQFTPDLMPTDITGTSVLDLKTSDFEFRPGPLFAQILLADEINRTPPKTQAALLEAMQERQVSVDGVPRPLPDPFLVVATQNPIEYEGTYPLPEAQLDRFLAKLDVGYPSADDEAAVLRLAHEGVAPATLADVQAVTSPAELVAARATVDATTVSEGVIGYVVALVRKTRELPSVSLGASPRGAVHLLAAAKAAARLAGRDFVTPDDVVAVAPAVLRHRLQLRPEAELERYTADDAVATAISTVPVPR